MKYNSGFEEKGAGYGKEMTEQEKGMLSKEQRESLGKLKDRTREL